MNDVCPVEITQQDFDSIKRCEAVVIREYVGTDGSRFARAVAWGDADEMQDQADTPGIFVVPVEFSIIGQQMVLVSDLLEPEAGGQER